MFKKTLFTTLFILFSQSVLADSYFGFAYSQSNFDSDVSSIPDVSPTVLELRLGKFILPELAIEGRVSTSFRDDNVINNIPTVVGNVRVESEFDTSHYGLLLTYGRELYGVLGVLDVELDVTVTGSAASVSVSQGASADETGAVFGIGYRASKERGLFAEYLIGTDDLDDVSWLSIGYMHTF